MLNKGSLNWYFIDRRAGGTILRQAKKASWFYKAAVAMQPARTKTATASRATAQSVVIMMGSFRSGGARAGRCAPN